MSAVWLKIQGTERAYPIYLSVPIKSDLLNSSK